MTGTGKTMKKERPLKNEQGILDNKVRFREVVTFIPCS